MASSYKSTQRWRHKIRQWLNEMMGGACQGCSYSKYYGNLAFHHTHGKDESISKMINRCASLESIIRETEKCVLVCHNCHGEIHAEIRECPRIDLESRRRRRLQEIRDKTPVPKKLKMRPCEECGRDIPSTRSYCNQECVHKAQEKIVWPEELADLVEASSVRSVARRLGVSDGAVKKRLLRRH